MKAQGLEFYSVVAERPKQFRRGGETKRQEMKK